MAKAAATAHPRRSKADVQQEFLKIREEVATTREARNAKVEEAAKLKEAEVRQAVDVLSVEGVAQSISALSIQISKALAEVSDDLIAEVQRLATIRAAVALERAELERLHKIDITATALDQLVQDYDSKSLALETEMSARRAAWDAEIKARERAEKEYDENLKKQRQRETEEYEYKKTIDRKKIQEKYDEDIRALEKKNREKQEALEKSWREREGAIKEREAEGRLSGLQIKTLDESVARQTAQMAALQKQLDEAKQEVQDIAVKAIEGASGARALSHVNQIAMEQAKTRAGQG